MVHLLWLSLLIPIVIHLVHRRRARRVPFSTLRFLRLVDQRVARRQRLKELLLLAVRLLMLAALVAALYRPMIRSATFRGANVPTDVAIVLDNTLSMRATSAGVRRFERAKRAALEVLDGLKRGDAAMLVCFDPAPGGDARPSTALGQVRDRLAAMQCGYGTGQAASALQRALEGLRKGDNPRKELYVMSDFQRHSWRDGLAELAGSIQPDWPVFLVDVGSEGGANLCVEAAQFGLNVQVLGSAADLYCRLRNTGSASAERSLALYLDEEKVAEQRMSLPAGAEGTVVFSHVFGRAGTFAGRVALGPDDLDADNERHFMVTVRDSLPVLLVNGAPSAVPYLNETFYLELALQAPPAAGKTVSPVQARTVGEEDFLKQRLEDYACVMLANVSRLSDLWAERLRHYVAGGGGLIIFCGDRVDPASYNTALGTGSEPLLPALLAEPREAQVARGEKPFQIARLDSAHPLFRGLAEAMDWAEGRVTKCLSVTPLQAAQEVAALAELDAGPLVLERRLGLGTVLLVTTTADMDWANLPAQSFFLPMVHQMVYYVGRTPGLSPSCIAGEPVVLELAPSEAAGEVKIYPPPAHEGPEPQPVAVLAPEEAPGGRRVVFAGAGWPGIWRAVSGAGEAERVHWFVVNVNTAESSLDRLEPHEAARMLDVRSVQVVRGPDRLAGVVRRERVGLPLWDYLFALALSMAVLEAFMGNVLLRH